MRSLTQRAMAMRNPLRRQRCRERDCATETLTLRESGLHVPGPNVRHGRRAKERAAAFGTPARWRREASAGEASRDLVAYVERSLDYLVVPDDVIVVKEAEEVDDAKTEPEMNAELPADSAQGQETEEEA
jgi:hypothetical protein